MTTDLFAWLTILYLLVLLGGMIAWRADRDKRDRLSADRVKAARREVNQLKIQLNNERESRRALEGYYLLEDAAVLDPEWRTTMAWADNELEANDPKGGTL